MTMSAQQTGSVKGAKIPIQDKASIRHQTMKRMEKQPSVTQRSVFRLSTAPPNRLQLQSKPCYPTGTIDHSHRRNRATAL
jgi:hypothetical protein